MLFIWALVLVLLSLVCALKMASRGLSQIGVFGVLLHSPLAYFVHGPLSFIIEGYIVQIRHVYYHEVQRPNTNMRVETRAFRGILQYTMNPQCLNTLNHREKVAENLLLRQQPIKQQKPNPRP